MTESTRPEVSDLGFVDDLLNMAKLTGAFRKEYQKCYSEFDEDETLEDDQIAIQARLTMNRYVNQIKESFGKLPDVRQLREKFAESARNEFLPKKINLPGLDESHMTPGMRHYYNVEERVEYLLASYEEFMESYREVFSDLEHGELLDQDTFNDPAEMCDELGLALKSFVGDFPSVVSPGDREQILGIGLNNPEVLGH